MRFSEWKEVKLDEVINFKNGRKKPDIEGNIPIYGGNGILGYTNSFNNENVVVIGRVGAYCGSVYYEPGKCWISDNAISAQSINDNSIEYVYYVLKSLKLNERRIGTGQPLLTQSILNSINTIYPEAEEQKAIAGTLSCLDDKIELNNNMNKTLEEMAKAIFKSWFVDFEPFQDGEFKDSELGRIPKGWNVKALYDFAGYINGTSFKKDEYTTSGYPIIKITEIKNGITSSTEYFSGNKDKKYYIKTSDILFSWSGNPQTSIDTFIWVGGDAILNQHTFKISIKNNDYCFIYLLLKFFKPEFTRIASSKQTTGLGHVTINDLKRIKFPYDDKVIDEFCIILNPVIELYVKNLLENKKLIDIRDSSLPKLMIGEIRVPTEEV